MPNIQCCCIICLKTTLYNYLGIKSYQYRLVKNKMVREDTNHGVRNYPCAKVLTFHLSKSIGCLFADKFSVFSVLPWLKTKSTKKPRFGVGAKLIVNLDVY